MRVDTVACHQFTHNRIGKYFVQRRLAMPSHFAIVAPNHYRIIAAVSHDLLDRKKRTVLNRSLSVATAV
jgi:hypothetical protein